MEVARVENSETLALPCPARMQEPAVVVVVLVLPFIAACTLGLHPVLCDEGRLQSDATERTNQHVGACVTAKMKREQKRVVRRLNVLHRWRKCSRCLSAGDGLAPQYKVSD